MVIQNQDTPLHYAVLSCSSAAVQLLLDKNATLNVQNKVIWDVSSLI